MPIDQFVIYTFTILISPLLAVQAAEAVNRRRQARERRVSVFRTLMATRAARLSPDHVKALNLVDIEFYGNDGSSKVIRGCWKAYVDHLSLVNPESDGWVVRRDDLFYDLLLRMATHLNYALDRTDLRRTGYFPRGHGELEDDKYRIRKGFIATFEGNASVPIVIREAPQAPSTAARV